MSIKAQLARILHYLHLRRKENKYNVINNGFVLF